MNLDLLLICYHLIGNIERDEAESIVHHIEDIFFNGSHPICKPVLQSQLITSRLVALDEGVSYVYSTEGLNPNDENSALVHYIQVLLLNYINEKNKFLSA